MQFDSNLLDAIAYIDGVRSVSFRQLFEEAFGLSELIVGEFSSSDLVGIQTKTSSELLTFILAVWMAKKTPVLFHPRFPIALVKKLAQHVGLRDPIVDVKKMGDLIYKSNPKGSFTTYFDETRIASVVFTSGSTGLPKAVAHNFGNHFASALGAHEHTPFQIGDRWAASLPMCHVGGLALFFRALIKGGTIVFLEKDRAFPEAIVSTGATHLSLIPTQLLSLVENQVRFLQHLKVLLIGGAPMPAPLFEKCIQEEIPIRLTYGMTETASQVATGIPFAKNGGRALNYRKIKIEDSEICVGGDVLFKGYIEKGNLVPRTEAWFATGDLGRFDEDGNLHVIGRKDNMFISGGENIQPEQVEKAILNLGLFSEVYVVPVEDAKFGFRPFVFVDTSCELDILHKKLVDKLPKFMWPVGINILPERLGLKVSRTRLRGLAQRQLE